MQRNRSGYIDLQVNGFQGIDFSSPEVTGQEIEVAFRALIERGTAGFLPTIITSSEQTYQRNLTLISGVIGQNRYKDRIPGIHLEGPFLSPEDGARGAHNRAWIRKPDKKLLDQMMAWSGGRIKMLTIAAERPEAADLCRHATDLGVTVSLGHQLAGEDDINRLVDAGAKALTHLGNGLPASVDRHRNPLWAGLANDNLTAMIIADGHHLPFSLTKVMLRAKGMDRICVVSDASPVAGLPAGRYHTLGNPVVLDDNGRLYNPNTGYLVGSSCTISMCVDYLETGFKLNQESLDRIAFDQPLQLIGMDPVCFLENLSGTRANNNRREPDTSSL